MNIKNNLVILFVLCLGLASNSSFNKKGKGPKLHHNNITEQADTLTIEQQKALEAFNTLQTSTDKKNRFYSTFTGVNHSCEPDDSTLIISRAELKTYLLEFTSKHCKKVADEVSQDLVEKAVLAQDEYTLSICLDKDLYKYFKTKYPTMGTWILSDVLDRRDVIIKW